MTERASGKAAAMYAKLYHDTLAQLAAAEREIVSLTEIARCETAFAMAARTRAEQIEAENQILRQKIKDLTFIIENPKP